MSKNNKAEIIGDIYEPKKYLKYVDRVEDLVIDYLVVGDARKFAIERKKIPDLKDSVKDGRLWRQLDVLKNYEKDGYIPILVIEGNLWWYRNKRIIGVREWIGYQIGIMLYDIPAIHIISKKDFVWLLERLREKAGKKTNRKRTVIKRRGRTILDERLDMLMQISGIGEVNAKKLIGKFEDIGSIADADLLDIMEAVGKDRAKHVIEVFHDD